MFTCRRYVKRKSNNPKNLTGKIKFLPSYRHLKKKKVSILRLHPGQNQSESLKRRVQVSVSVLFFV